MSQKYEILWINNTDGIALQSEKNSEAFVGYDLQPWMGRKIKYETTA